MLDPLTLTIGAVMLGAAATDLRHYQIPNMIPAALVLLFFAAVASGRISQPELHAAVGLMLLISGVALFASGLAGAGDGKFLAACGLFAGPQGIDSLLFWMALTGGVLAVLLLMHRRWMAKEQDRYQPSHLPYGVAIALGGLLTLPLPPTS